MLSSLGVGELARNRLDEVGWLVEVLVVDEDSALMGLSGALLSWEGILDR